MENKEDILAEVFIKELTNRYQIEEDSLIAYGFNRLQLSNMTRGRVPFIKREDQEKELGLFFIEELSLYLDEQNKVYIGKDSFETSFYLGTAFANVMDNLFFRASCFDADLAFTVENRLKQALTIGRKKSISYRKTPIYEDMVSYYSLLELNAIYGAIPQPVRECSFLIKEEGYFALLKEEALERNISSFKRMEQYQIKQLEKDVEEYLFKNLHLIEEGLRPIKRQVLLPEGRMDILARDKNGRDVIIELKTEDDTDIVWQREYYVSEWEKHHYTPRFIVVATNLKKSVIESLFKKGDTELFLCQTTTRKGKIVGMILKKLNKKEESVHNHL